MEKIEPFFLPTSNSALVYRKRYDWTVPHPNGEHCYIVTDWTLRCYSEKIQEESLPFRTESSALTYQERQSWIIVRSEQRALQCLIEKDKTECSCFPTENAALSRLQRPEASLYIRTLDSAFLYGNKQGWAVSSSSLSNLHWYTKTAKPTCSPFQQSSLHFHNTYLSSSKCSSQQRQRHFKERPKDRLLLLKGDYTFPHANIEIRLLHRKRQVSSFTHANRVLLMVKRKR